MNLDSWRVDQKLTFDGLGARLDCSRATAWRLCRGARVPDRAQMARIREVTGGAVTPNDFYTEPPQAPSAGEAAAPLQPGEVPANA